MEKSKEDFLARWSRRKQETRQAPPAAPVSASPAARADAPPSLPKLEDLGFDSDFAAFLHPKVDEGLRRAALKKLFGDPRFNVMDGLDVYIDDYGKPDPLDPGMLEKLAHWQSMLAARTREEAGKEAREPQPEAPEAKTAPAPLVDGRDAAEIVPGMPGASSQPVAAGASPASDDDAKAAGE